MKNILIMTSSYLPGVKGGGPIRSIANLVDSLGSEYKFYIITKNKDFGDKDIYPNIKKNSWNSVGKCHVFYVDKLRFSFFEDILRSIEFEDIYINSFFSTFSIKTQLYLLLSKKYKNIKTIIAVRGEFAEAALQMKSFKKKVYLKLYKLFIYRKNYIFQATSSQEKEDVKFVIKNANVKLVPNLAENRQFNVGGCVSKRNGELRLIYISRIAPIKNLEYAIDCLRNINEGNIIYDIYGPIEDKKYWDNCLEKIKVLPPNIKVSYKGLINHDEIKKVYKQYHAFLLPTKTENFGHVINEGLKSACIPIITDKTPWNNLDEFKCGWNIKLKDKEGFVKAIETLVDMDSNELEKYRMGIKSYLDKNDSNQKSMNLYRAMF